jgi:hypothetical protein
MIDEKKKTYKKDSNVWHKQRATTKIAVISSASLPVETRRDCFGLI